MMEIVDNYFEQIHSTESIFKQPIIEANKLCVPCKELVLMGDHPICIEKKIYKLYDCLLMFKGVYTSRRNVSEYFFSSSQIISTKASEIRTIVDLHSEEIPKDAIKFELEGRMENPLSSISDWVIYADSFSLLFDSNKSELFA